jgi:hypothetical protein
MCCWKSLFIQWCGDTRKASTEVKQLKPPLMQLPWPPQHVLVAIIEKDAANDGECMQTLCTTQRPAYPTNLGAPEAYGVISNRCRN